MEESAATSSVAPPPALHFRLVVRPNTAYLEYKKRLIYYHDKHTECDIVAGKVNVLFALNANATGAAREIVLVGRLGARKVTRACEAIHERLFEVDQSVWDRDELTDRSHVFQL